MQSQEQQIKQKYHSVLFYTNKDGIKQQLQSVHYDISFSTCFSFFLVNEEEDILDFWTDKQF